ncbi:MAG: hypothetical protein ACFE0Q_16145 [Anaerolineae bacterium]
MQWIRRLLYLPLIGVLVGTVLIMFNIVEFDRELPIAIEWIAMLAGGLLSMFTLLDMRQSNAYEHPEPEEPPRSTKVIYPKVLEKTVESMHEAEEYVVKANGRIDIEIDIEEDPEEEV